MIDDCYGWFGTSNVEGGGHGAKIRDFVQKNYFWFTEISGSLTTKETIYKILGRSGA